MAKAEDIDAILINKNLTIPLMPVVFPKIHLARDYCNKRMKVWYQNKLVVTAPVMPDAFDIHKGWVWLDTHMITPGQYEVQFAFRSKNKNKKQQKQSLFPMSDCS